MEGAALSRIGLAGLAVMGQNLALNIAEKGFPISVYNRTTSKVDETLDRAAPSTSPHRPLLPPRLRPLHPPPRSIILLVKAGAPVDLTISALLPHLSPGDSIIDGGNEWYLNTDRRLADAESRNLLYLGMGVSGGEDGARHGPSLMPGGHLAAYKTSRTFSPPSQPRSTTAPASPTLAREAPGISSKCNAELGEVFGEWNRGELESFLIEITADIFRVRDEEEGGELVDKILDKTGMKGTGKWTVQQAAELSVAAPTIAASLDCRGGIDRKRLVDDVRQALYASKICSYAQGMNLLRAKSDEKGWGLNLGELARIWKGGCIIRAVFLDRIKRAYQRNPQLASLVVDPEFAREMVQRQAAWRRVVGLAIQAGISTPGMCASLAYFDTYRRARLPANLVQAQRDLFGAHTYERVDRPGSFHTEWTKLARQSKAGVGAFN
ncbi:hypothetical protein Syun_011636 [Stephania yunnanensis]|uniref:phosphogluconate dehydrogenase (NADP(+)-dependent, decarboxylating) n=1 Tax=Stephania yunnanensis TaxID=152371 RepID=A0AAP0JXY5_9MAGN